MNKRKQGRKCSIVDHVIWPLVCFAAGILLASFFLRPSQDEADLKKASGRSDAAAHELHLTKLQISRLETTIESTKGALSDMTAQKDSWMEKYHRSEEKLTSMASVPAEHDWSKEVAEEQAWAAQVQGERGGGSSGNAVKWTRLNKWHSTELEPLSFSNAFDIGLPIDTIKWSGGFLMVPTSGGLKGAPPEAAGSALDHIQHSCAELDVVVLNDQHCVAVTHVNGAQAGHNTPYHLSRFVKGGGGGRGKNKRQEVDAKDKDAFSLVSRLGKTDGAPPSASAQKTHRKALARFFASVDEVEAELLPILERIAAPAPPDTGRSSSSSSGGDSSSSKGTVVTMTMNAGMSDMFLNFACSSSSSSSSRNRAGEEHGGGGEGSSSSASMLQHLLVFPTDDEAVEVASSVGVAHYRHSSFGKFPKEEAGSYGDNTFVAMMWIKVLCVYLPVSLGFNVLFQDADVVWLRNPIHDYFHVAAKAGDFDVYFQDDGSRSTRFSPYFSNSGFYFLRQTPRTRYFMTMLLYQGDTILEWRSHQAALVQVLADASSKFGLKVKTLSYKDFPSGKDYHHRKPYMQAWARGEEEPYAFHMCWTQNKVDKVKYLKQLGGWFLKRTCDEDAIRSPDFLARGALMDSCCSTEPVVDCFFRDKASIVPCKDSPNKDKNQPSWW